LEADPQQARINCHFWKSPVTPLAEMRMVATPPKVLFR
jgi:hypothetical protein